MHFLGTKEVLLHPFSLLFFFLLFLVLKWFFTAQSSNKNFPPSPPKLPVVGNLHQLGLSPHHNLRSLSQRYGKLMLLHLGSAPTLVVSSPTIAREIMKTQDLAFASRPDSSIARRLLYDYKDLATAPYGEYWRHMRSICVLHLLSAKKVQSFQSVREEEIAIMMKKIERSSVASSPINLVELLASLTNDIVCRVAFGRKYNEGERGKKFKELLGEFGGLLGIFNVEDFIPSLAWLNNINGLNSGVEKVFQELDHFLNEVIDDHMARLERKNADMRARKEDQTDFVDVLLEIQKDNTDGVSVGRESIKALILDMFAAGTDTTYTVMEWTMARLLGHPIIMKKVQAEIRENAGTKVNITEDDAGNFPYLNAVIKETMRLHPPIPLLVPRESTKEVKIQGYDIAAKTRVIINAWAIGRDPETWAEPEEFKPERFLNSTIDYKGHDFQLIPFGAGRRGCPGTSFATAIIVLTLANLLLKFDWTLPAGEALDMSESTGITIHLKSPLRVVASVHNSNHA